MGAQTFLKYPLYYGQGQDGGLLASNNLSDVDNVTQARLNLGIDTTQFLLVSNNLSDLGNAATARTNLGLGTAALTNTGLASGNVPVLDSGGKLNNSVLPALAIGDVFTVSSQSAMLALSAHQGDLAIRTDLNETFALSTSDPTTLANWIQILSPTAAVSSVAGRVGAVVLTTSDIGGLGTIATHAAGDYLAVTNNLSDLGSAATARTNLGLGTAATHAAGDFLLSANNLSDLASASTARTNLGLGSSAVLNAATSMTVSTVVERDSNGDINVHAGNFTGRVLLTETALTMGSTVATDASLGNVYTGTTAVDFTMSIPTNAPTSGATSQGLLYRLKNSDSADHTATFATGTNGFRLSGDVNSGSLAVTLKAGKQTYVLFRWNNADSKWDMQDVVGQL